jgi:hypothetical protein
MVLLLSMLLLLFCLSIQSMSSAIERGESTELLHWSLSLLHVSSSLPLPRLSRLSGVAGVLSQEPWLRSATEADPLHLALEAVCWACGK